MLQHGILLPVPAINARHIQVAIVLISATMSNFEMDVQNNDNLLSMLLLQLLSSVTLLYCLALPLIDEPWKDFS